VDSEAAGAEDGTSWSDAYTDLQDALDFASNPVNGVDQIWVAQGTYKPSTLVVGGDARSAAFSITFNDVALYGGFSGDGTETTILDRDEVMHPTLLSGDLGTANVVTDDAYHVLRLIGVNSTVVVNGFVIEKGNANGSGVTNGQTGGGLLILNAAPRIVRCVVRSNRASAGGGGAFVNGTTETPSNPLFANVQFLDNACQNEGGGLFVQGASNFNAVNCLFARNSSPVFDGGGGLFTTDNAGPVPTGTITNH
jgi:hypothetical protein